MHKPEIRGIRLKILLFPLVDIHAFLDEYYDEGLKEYLCIEDEKR
jgi:hypothetical protein